MGDDEEVGGGHEGHVVVPAGVGAAFEVSQAEACCQFPVVVFDAPPDFGQANKFFQRCVLGQGGEPVVGGCRAAR